MIEPNYIYYFVNFGVLGLWTWRLLKKEDQQKHKTEKLIENNTKALTLVYENIKYCEERNKK